MRDLFNEWNHAGYIVHELCVGWMVIAHEHPIPMTIPSFQYSHSCSHFFGDLLNILA